MKYIKEKNIMKFESNLESIVANLNENLYSAGIEANRIHLKRNKQVEDLYVLGDKLYNELIINLNFKNAHELLLKLRKDFFVFIYQNKHSMKTINYNILKSYISEVKMDIWILELFFKQNIEYLENKNHKKFISLFLKNEMEKNALIKVPENEEKDKTTLNENLNFSVNVYNVPPLYDVQFDVVVKSKKLYKSVIMSLSSMIKKDDSFKSILEINQNICDLYENIEHVFTRCDKNMQILKLKQKTVLSNFCKNINLINYNASKLNNKELVKNTLKYSKDILWQLEYLSKFTDVLYESVHKQAI